MNCGKQFRILALTLGVCCCGLSTARAAEFIYEGFAYDTGEVTNANGGRGFEGAWQPGGATMTVAEDGLTHGELKAVGAALTGASSGAAQASRLFGKGHWSIRQPGSEVWASFLYQHKGGDAAMAFSSHEFDTEVIEKPALVAVGADEKKPWGVGVQIGKQRGAMMAMLCLFTTGDRYRKAEMPIELGEGPVLLLMRCNWTGKGEKDTVTLWVVPNDGGTLADAPSISFQANAPNTLYNRLALYSTDANTFDEVRVAYVKEGETSQNALDQVTPGLGVKLQGATDTPDAGADEAATPQAKQGAPNELEANPNAPF